MILTVFFVLNFQVYPFVFVLIYFQVLCCWLVIFSVRGLQLMLDFHFHSLRYLNTWSLNKENHKLAAFNMGLDTHTSVTLFVVVVFCLGHIMTSWWITLKCLILRLLYRVWTHHPDIQTCATVMSKSPLLSLEWAPKPDRLVRQQLLKVGTVWPTAS